MDKTQCCGLVYSRKDSLLRHQQSQKHQTNMNQYEVLNNHQLKFSNKQMDGENGQTWRNQATTQNPDKIAIAKSSVHGEDVAFQQKIHSKQVGQIDMFAHGLSVEQKQDNEGGIQNLYSNDINDESKVLEGQIHSESTTLVSSTFKGKVSLAENNSPDRASYINLSNLNSSFKPSSGLQQLDLNKVLEDYILRSDHDKIVADKDKQIVSNDKLMDELRQDKSKLEEKLETKDRELIQLRSQAGGLEVQCLKIELAQVKVRLEERDKQLMEWKVVADKLMKSKATFEKWKQEMDVLSVRSSVDNSPQQTPVQSEYGHSDHEMEGQSSAQELFGLANIGLTCYAAAALQCIQAISVNLKGKLAVDKFQNAQSLRDFYEAKLYFPNIFSQNDSSEALLQFMQGHISGRLTSIQTKQIRNTKCRQCNTITQTYQTELLLQLPCSHSHFSDCIRTYLTKESLVMDNQFECNICGSKTDADTWLEIKHTNDIFIVQLNRFAHDGIASKKKNDCIEMPPQFVINNQQYELFAFALHVSEKDTEGHYIAYVKQYEVWNEYNDDKVTTSVDIGSVKDKAYYYCYHRVVDDYFVHVEQTAQANVVERQCAYCHDVVVGLATYYVLGNSEVQIAGAMVDHLKLCDVLVSSQKRIRLALEKHNKEHSLLSFPQQDIRAFFSQTSRALTESCKQVCTNMKLVKKATKRSGTKVLRSKAENLPNLQELEEQKQEMETLKAEIAAIACTWTYKWDPVFVQKTPYIIVGGEIAWAGYVPPAIESITTAVADGQGNHIYGTNTTRSNVVDSIYGKKRTAQDRKLERQAKIASGVALTLVEQKAEETDNICKLIEQNKQLFQSFQDWMMKHKVKRDLNDPNLKKFEWVGPVFCDGIIVPKLPIFENNNQYQAFLQKYGRLQIQKISDAADPDCLYVRLLDSANQFTQKLIEGLNDINNELLIQMNEYSATQQQASVGAMNNCHIRQVDYTRDMKGAFYSYDMKADLDTLAKLLGMRKATHDEYTSIDSCFQFLKHCKGKAKEFRMKFYNKIFHLIQSEQGKKKVSMNLKALINCSAAFFEKIDQCIREGLSRCEFSLYFDSAKDLAEKLKFDDCNSNLNKALEALNKVPSVYNMIPPIQFLDDYFETFASNLFIFEKYQWAVVYGRNRLSSYMGIIGNPCKMGKEEFIARYTHSNIINIIDNTDKSDLPKDTLVQATRTGPHIMQIPMQSLGVVHKINNMFDLKGTRLTLAMSNKAVKEIQLLKQDGTLMFKPHEKKQTKKEARLKKRDLKALEKKIPKLNTHFTKVQPKNSKSSGGSKSDAAGGPQETVPFYSKPSAKRPLLYKTELNSSLCLNEKEMQGNHSHKIVSNGSRMQSDKKHFLWKCANCKKTYRTYEKIKPEDGSVCV